MTKERIKELFKAHYLDWFVCSPLLIIFVLLCVIAVQELL